MSEHPWPRWPAFAAPDGALLPVNELMESRYRHHLTTGFSPALAVVLAEWDVASYLRITGGTRARHDEPHTSQRP